MGKSKARKTKQKQKIGLIFSSKLFYTVSSENMNLKINVRFHFDGVDSMRKS